MFKTMVLLALCACSVTAYSRLADCGAQSSSDSSASVSARKVDVKSVVKVLIAKDTPGYLIAYEYDFPERGSVYIAHLGTVPAKGSFRYVSTEKLLEFRDGPDGEILVSVPLLETVIVAAKPPLMRMPDEKQFPDASLTVNWDSRWSLQERANAVLGKYFRYDPRNDKGTVYLRTTFTPLQLKGLPDGVTAQMAVLLSFPGEPQTSKYSFRIQELIMEGRTHSDEFRPTSNPSIIDSANLFVNNLIAEMKALEDGKP